jgi:hypothetical protein
VREFSQMSVTEYTCCKPSRQVALLTRRVLERLLPEPIKKS